MSDFTIDRNGKFQHNADEGFKPGPVVQGQRAPLTGLRPLRAYAQIQHKITVKMPLEKPLYSTGRKRYPAAALPGASVYLEAKPLPADLAHAEHTHWHCKCTKQPPPGAFGTSYDVSCPHGPGPWKTVDELRAAHPPDSVLSKAGEVHVFYATRELEEADGLPGEVTAWTIDGAER
jgi:hypothetical protein